MRLFLSTLLLVVVFIFSPSLHAIPPVSDDIEFTYDTQGRLIKAEYVNGTVIEYTYDATGNRTKKVVSDGSAPPPTIEYALTSTGVAVSPYYLTSANYYGTIVYTLWYPAGNTTIFGWASTSPAGCASGSPVAGWSHTGNGCEIRKD